MRTTSRAAGALLREDAERGLVEIGEIAVRADERLLGGRVLGDGREQPARFLGEHAPDRGRDHRRGDGPPTGRREPGRGEQLGEPVAR